MVVDFDILTVIVGVLIYLGVCIFINWKYKKKKIYYVFSTIMFCYLMYVVKITMFPIIMLDGMPSNIRECINYIPFLNGGGKTDIYNLIMTIPMGIGMPFVKKIRGAKGMMIVGLVTGCIIEMIQYLETFLTGGFTLRIIDINDVIFNFCGVIIGYAILRLVSRIFVKYGSAEYNSFWKYIYEVCEKVYF